MLKLILFTSVLIYASVIDVKTRIVPTNVLVLLLIIGLLNVSLLSLVGLFIVFIPFFIISLFTNIGGGDVKLMAMCGFILQGTNGIMALLIGLLIAAIFVPIINKLNHKPINSFFPLVPYLSAGCVITNIIILK